MVAITRSQSRCPARTSAKCPSCRAPMVGTSATVSPAARKPRTSARKSTIRRTMASSRRMPTSLMNPTLETGGEAFNQLRERRDRLPSGRSPPADLRDDADLAVGAEAGRVVVLKNLAIDGDRHALLDLFAEAGIA